MSLDETGNAVIQIEELERIELQVGATSGHVLNGERRSLPIGSTLRGGTFYWQPGPGFLGEYNFLFERPNASRLPVRVSIHPKGSSRTEPRQ